MTLEEKQIVADLLHAEYCKSMHVDVCGYFYGSWEEKEYKKNSAKVEELEKVEKLLSKYGYNWMKKLVEIIQHKNIIDGIYKEL